MTLNLLSIRLNMCKDKNISFSHQLELDMTQIFDYMEVLYICMFSYCALSSSASLVFKFILMKNF